MAKIIDISWPITPDMTTYKNRNDVTCNQYKTYEQDGVRESHWSASLHTGTHVDAPAHFLKDGAPIDAYELSQLSGWACVIDYCHVSSVITADDIAEDDVMADTITLFRTKNSQKKPTDSFDTTFVYLDATAADKLVASRVKAVGIDYLGIERDQPQHETHKTLLSHHIPIIEGLRLAHVPPGMYHLWCLPLLMPGADAAPARAVLQSMSS